MCAACVCVSINECTRIVHEGQGRTPGDLRGVCEGRTTRKSIHIQYIWRLITSITIHDLAVLIYKV